MAGTCREATNEDIPAMQHVAERAWKQAHAPIIGEETTTEFLEQYYDTESLRGVLDRNRWIGGVAETDQTVLGFVSGGPDDDDSGLFYLGRLYVLPDRWGEGVGRQLLEWFEQRVTERSGLRIQLRVMADNERAVRFYEEAGYERDKRIYDDAVGTHSYIYSRQL